jgi:hypothetical protein
VAWNIDRYPEADGRSLSNWVTKLIAKQVEKAEREQGNKDG